MATQQLCSIPDCSKPVFGHGWCSAHYTRWRRRGDPLGVSTSHGDPQKYFAKVVLAYEGTDCLFWPYGRDVNGYGTIWHGGKQCGVHRLACIAAHGEPPSKGHQAAHDCGNGHLGCCNPRHLSWKTKAENQADRSRHGTHQLGEQNAVAKLTADAVREIRALRGVMPQADIGKRYGIQQVHVGRIQRRERWGWLD